MRLTTKTRYAITAMLDLAVRGSNGPLTLADISENQGISISYLEQLFASLRAKGLVRGVRGPGGGYYLGHDADQITVADVICAVDEWVEQNMDKTRRKDAFTRTNTTRDLWDDLSQQIFDLTAAISLYDLIRRGEVREAALRNGRAGGAVGNTPSLAVIPGSDGRALIF